METREDTVATSEKEKVTEELQKKYNTMYII